MKWSFFYYFGKLTLIGWVLIQSVSVFGSEPIIAFEPPESLDREQAEKLGVFIDIADTSSYTLYVFNFDQFKKCDVGEVAAKMSFSDDSYFTTRLVKDKENAYVLASALDQKGSISLSIFCSEEFRHYVLNLDLR